MVYSQDDLWFGGISPERFLVTRDYKREGPAALAVGGTSEARNLWERIPSKPLIILDGFSL